MFRRKKGPRDDEGRRRDGEGGVEAFACERVCTSDRLIKRLGYLSKVRAAANSERVVEMPLERTRFRVEWAHFMTVTSLPPTTIGSWEPGSATSYRLSNRFGIISNVCAATAANCASVGRNERGFRVEWAHRVHCTVILTLPPMTIGSWKPGSASRAPGLIGTRALNSRLNLLSPVPSPQDPTPNTCVTVCGTSGIDACTEACQRSVCSIPHSVGTDGEDSARHAIIRILNPSFLESNGIL